MPNNRITINIAVLFCNHAANIRLIIDNSKLKLREMAIYLPCLLTGTTCSVLSFTAMRGTLQLNVKWLGC
jgi:hypothetical protein